MGDTVVVGKRAAATANTLKSKVGAVGLRQLTVSVSDLERSMSINRRGEVTSEVRRGRPEGGFLGLLRATALIAVLEGAGGSVGLMLHAGRRNRFPNPAGTFCYLGALPVHGPHIGQRGFETLVGTYRATLYSVMLVLTLGSLAIYGDVVLGPPRAKTAFVFVVVPPASWLLIAIVVPIAALISGKLLRRGDST
ncbi:MAG: hypothetical protein DMG49_03360 [Acidobacteria bacterium]|nr:MAG: hypothetical protein DMG49_03360 [Acidobacteriota bacterium]